MLNGAAFAVYEERRDLRSCVALTKLNTKQPAVTLISHIPSSTMNTNNANNANDAALANRVTALENQVALLSMKKGEEETKEER